MTPDEIKKLKAKHGEGLQGVVITVDGQSHEFVIKKPSRNVIEAIAETTEISKQNDILLQNCVVHGDAAAYEDGDVYLELIRHIGGLQGQAVSELKKL